MSIEREIISQDISGRLKLVVPRVSSDQLIRRLYLTKQLYAKVYEEKETESEKKMFENLKADLQVFVSSNTIDPKYLWCLRPPENGIWEIRSTRQRPQIRVFGAFAAKDVFIGTHYKLRDELGKIDSRQWEMEIARTKTIWTDHFPTYTHKKTTDQKQLFTGALDEKYFR